MSRLEFVLLIGFLMAMNALSIDPMLPALPQMGEALAISDPNDRQWIVTAYTLGLSVGALIYGSISDRYGRRPVLLVTLAVYLLATLLCAFANSFAMMLAARVLAGFMAAASRVVAVSIVRDRFVGDEMARVMSVAFTVFMIVPIVAPLLGQIVTMLAGWRWIFGILFLFALMTGIWVYARLPETLAPENRVPIRPADLMGSILMVLGHRSAIGYMLATGLSMGALFGFIVSAQQIFVDVFDAGAWFAPLFALVPMGMALGSILSGRLVGRYGARRLSQTALIGMIGLSSLHSVLILLGWESLTSFVILFVMTLFCFALVMPNFGAISMEPFGRGAGAASSFQAFLTMVIGSVAGAIIGACFDGSAVPLVVGFALCSSLALLLVLWAERGRLFTRPGGFKEPHPAR
ncbi:MAG: multidrug effflux MFS transporter [Neomegalonema sp.]|nr:multidrug effflux MFS transporter [Neomegalonema sp.]